MRVPMLIMSTKLRSSKSAAMVPARTPETTVERTGVWKVGETWESQRKTRPSEDMA